MNAISSATPAAQPAAEPVALIGCGMMGEAIGRRLLERGHALVVWDRTPARRELLATAGASVARSPRAAAESARTVLLMLRDARACRRVLFGRAGAANGLNPESTVVNLSTISPEEAGAIAEDLRGRGFAYLDAPVGGSVDAALRGELLSFVGGEGERLNAVRPVLDAFSRRVERMGPVGAGSAMKLVNNLLTLAHVAALGEALALAEASQLDRTAVLEMLSVGGGASAMLERKRAAIERREYPVQFKLELAAKDAGLIEREARRRGLKLVLAHHVRRRYDTARKAGVGGQDFAVVVEPATPAPSPAPGSPPAGT